MEEEKTWESINLKRFQRGRRAMGIFELADLFGVTTEALRKYEGKSILQPYRDENGYRKYSSWELTKLVRIRQLRQTGLSLEDISNELKLEEAGQWDQSMEQLEKRLLEEIAYREKLLHWIDVQQNEIQQMENRGETCQIEQKGRQYCCVYMVHDTLVNKTGKEREHLKEWIQALPFARIYYIKGLQQDTLSCLALEEEEMERYGFRHLVPDFILPAWSYVVCNAPQEHQIHTEISETSEILARQMAERTGFALQPLSVLQMVWYTYQEGLFHSYNKAMFPIKN